METELMKLASEHGIWALITMLLIYYILKAQEKRDIRQEEREIKYQDIIKELTAKLIILEELNKDIKEIRDYIYERNESER